MPLAERQLLNRLRSRVRVKNPKVALGIGDDCALLRVPKSHEVLVTTDFSLEQVHFRRDWQSPECIGHRCLARGLSDIAAMGGRPVSAFLSLALPSRLAQRWVDRFFAGLLRLARAHKVQLAGGDMSQSPGGVLADIAIVGVVKRRQALVRSGARVGDQIYVTGELGESAAALRLLSSGERKTRNVFPQPRIAVGEWLAHQRIASAAIDISDGLSSDLSHICEASGVGAVIDAEAVPIHSEARKMEGPEHRANSPRGPALQIALHGGEDYELLFTVPRSKPVPTQIAGVKISRIGEIVRGRTMYLVRSGTRELLLAQGWEYFRLPR